eukprot:971415-Pyramimonas_sp.AAC.1
MSVARSIGLHFATLPQTCVATSQATVISTHLLRGVSLLSAFGTYQWQICDVRRFARRGASYERV